MITRDILAICQTRRRTARTCCKHDRPVNIFNYLIPLRDKVATSAATTRLQANRWKPGREKNVQPRKILHNDDAPIYLKEKRHISRSLSWIRDDLRHPAIKLTYPQNVYETAHVIARSHDRTAKENPGNYGRYPARFVRFNTFDIFHPDAWPQQQQHRGYRCRQTGNVRLPLAHNRESTFAHGVPCSLLLANAPRTHPSCSQAMDYGSPMLRQPCGRWTMGCTNNPDGRGASEPSSSDWSWPCGPDVNWDPERMLRTKRSTPESR